MYSSTSIKEHLELFRFTLSFCKKKKKKKKSLPTYQKFLDRVGRGQTNIFLNAAQGPHLSVNQDKLSVGEWDLYFVVNIVSS